MSAMFVTILLQVEPDVLHPISANCAHEMFDYVFLKFGLLCEFHLSLPLAAQLRGVPAKRYADFELEGE